MKYKAAPRGKPLVNPGRRALLGGHAAAGGAFATGGDGTTRGGN
jgi:hypothetical protein